jgi:hypothetical protein
MGCDRLELIKADAVGQRTEYRVIATGAANGDRLVRHRHPIGNPLQAHHDATTIPHKVYNELEANISALFKSYRRQGAVQAIDPYGPSFLLRVVDKSKRIREAEFFGDSAGASRCAEIEAILRTAFGSHPSR